MAKKPPLVRASNALNGLMMLGVGAATALSSGAGKPQHGPGAFASLQKGVAGKDLAARHMGQVLARALGGKREVGAGLRSRIQNGAVFQQHLVQNWKGMLEDMMGEEAAKRLIAQDEQAALNVVMRTVVGFWEARGDGKEGLFAVNKVLTNRAAANYRGFGRGVWPQSFAVSQISSMTPTAGILAKMGGAEGAFNLRNDPKGWQDSLAVALAVEAGQGSDEDKAMMARVNALVDDAMDYYNPDVASPDWSLEKLSAGKRVVTIGRHLFLPTDREFGATPERS